MANWTTVLHDTFATNVNDWRVGVERDEFFDPLSQAFVDGCYRWDAQRGPRLSTNTAWALGSLVADFHCSASCRHTAGSRTGSSWGIAFQVQDLLNYFVFRMADSQFFAVAAVESGRWCTVADWTRAASIKPGAVNQLSVLALDYHFELLINGRRVYEFEDERAKNSGHVGLAMEMYGAGEKTTFDFVEFELRTP